MAPLVSRISPPATMQPVVEPVYETPDPYLRSFDAGAFREHFARGDGAAIAAALRDAPPPISTLLDLDFKEVTPGRASVSMPASEWLCLSGADVSPNAIASLAHLTGWNSVLTVLEPGRSMAALDDVVRFLRPARADGRRLRAESRSTEGAPYLWVVNTEVRDADSQLVALHTGSITLPESTQRDRGHRRESRRVLATLLFTDIVDSTGHAKRLGDSGWQSLLEEQRLSVRREVSRHNGTEVDTAGDGFFSRFDSPVRAIDAACAARRASKSLGIEIRTGIHTGECELQGSKLAGIAVHIAARIQASAKGGEVLVSSTVKDLSVGSGRRFDDRGEHDLKGVTDPWRLYAVVD